MAEGIPFEEIKMNPYMCLVTTEVGGHLGWFQFGQGRWFAKPASRFLRKMATEINLDGDFKPKECVGSPSGVLKGVFRPTRHRLLLGSLE